MLHYPRVPVLAGVLAWQVVLLWIVQQRLARLILFCPVAKFIRLAALAHLIHRVALADLILRLLNAAIGPIVIVAILGRALSLANGYLVNQDYFRQFRSDL